MTARLASLAIVVCLAGCASERATAPPAQPQPYYTAPGPPPVQNPTPPPNPWSWPAILTAPWMAPLPPGWTLPPAPAWFPFPPGLWPPAPPSTAPPATDDIRRQELYEFELVNRDRQNPAFASETQGRAAPLVWDEGLAQVARAHSQDMMTRGFFDHTNPDGLGPADRVNRARIPWSAVSENIAIAPSVDAAHRAFMDEPAFQPNHRGNILSFKYSHLGVGVVRDARGTLFLTENFRRP